MLERKRKRLAQSREQLELAPEPRRSGLAGSAEQRPGDGTHGGPTAAPAASPGGLVSALASGGRRPPTRRSGAAAAGAGVGPEQILASGGTKCWDANEKRQFGPADRPGADGDRLPLFCRGRGRSSWRSSGAGCCCCAGRSAVVDISSRDGAAGCGGVLRRTVAGPRRSGIRADWGNLENAMPGADEHVGNDRAASPPGRCAKRTEAAVAGERSSSGADPGKRRRPAAKRSARDELIDLSAERKESGEHRVRRGHGSIFGSGGGKGEPICWWRGG